MECGLKLLKTVKVEIMKTLEWFTTLFERKKNSSQYIMLPPKQTRLSNGKSPDSTELKAGEHYFRLLLVEMFLANDRKWLTDWFPIVHTSIKFKFGDQQELLTHIAGESFLNQLGEQKPGRVVSLNYPLTPLLPFNGGSVELNASLIGVAGGNDVLAGLQILGSFSQLLLVPQLSVALAVAMPLADGVAKFVGATKNQMLLGLHQFFASESGGANILRAGYFVVIDTDKKIKPENLFVVDDKLRLGSNIESSVPLSGFDYMLFRIESRDERDDWDSLSGIQAPYKRAIEMLQAGNTEQANAFIKAAIAAAFTAKELTAKVDRRRVIDELEKAYNEARDLFDSIMRGQNAFEVSTDVFKFSNRMKYAEKPSAAAKRGMLSPEIIGLGGLTNHSLIKAESHLSYINDYKTSSLMDFSERETVSKDEEIVTGVENQKESFFFALEGDRVRGNTVLKGSAVDLIFDYAIPKANVITLVTGEQLEAVTRDDATLGLMVSPRGFIFTDKKESGYRQIKISGGKFVDGAVRFQLKAFDAESYEKAFAQVEKEIPENVRGEAETPLYSTGFHITFDVKSVQIYRFFLPVKLADAVSEKDDLLQPLNFDLDMLNKSTKYVTKARRHLEKVISNIITGKEGW